MSDEKEGKKKLDLRFLTQVGEMETIFISQCNKCRKNFNMGKCEKFEIKPNYYSMNEVECPFKDDRGEK